MSWDRKTPSTSTQTLARACFLTAGSLSLVPARSELREVRPLTPKGPAVKAETFVEAISSP